MQETLFILGIFFMRCTRTKTFPCLCIKNTKEELCSFPRADVRPLASFSWMPKYHAEYFYEHLDSACSCNNIIHEYKSLKETPARV